MRTNRSRWSTGRRLSCVRAFSRQEREILIRPAATWRKVEPRPATGPHPSMAWLNVDSRMDLLRTDPRFSQYLQRVGL